MKVLVLLSLVAFCASVPTYQGKRVVVGQDGTVSLIGNNGYEMNIFSSLVDPKKVVVTTSTPYGSSRTYQIDATNNMNEVQLRNIFGNKYSNYQDVNQQEILTDIFRQFQGVVDEQSYVSLLHRIQLLVNAGVFNKSILDVVRSWSNDGSLHQVSDYVPSQDYYSYGISGVENQWNAHKNLYNIDSLQTLLHQIREQRALQEGLLDQQRLYSQRYQTPEVFDNELSENEILRQIYQQQYGQSQGNQVNSYLVNLRLSNGQEEYSVPEEFLNTQMLDKLYTLQQWINSQADASIERRQPFSQYSYNKQLYVNQQVEKIIQQLTYHQTYITRQVEQLVQQRQSVPQELVYQQRLVYQQVQRLIGVLVYQQGFVNKIYYQLTVRGDNVPQGLYDQQSIIYKQIQTLIQQLFVQQTVLKQQIQVLVQQGQVVPEQLVLFQQMTYQQVERFVQVLIKQFIIQQTYFQQWIQNWIQQGRVIPQEMISQYTVTCSELQELIQRGDVVPQEYVYHQRLIHQQIMALIQRGTTVSQQHLGQWAPQQDQTNWFRGESVYQRLPVLY